MRSPRNLAGEDLIRRLGRLVYKITRQTGSRIRLTSVVCDEHHITVPNDDPLCIGVLATILDRVADHQGVTRDELLRQLLD